MASNLVSMMKEETTAKNITELMKEIVQASGAPEATRRALRTKIEELCGDTRSKEHTRRVEEFSFTVPRRSLDSWKNEVRAKQQEPVSGVHFKVEYSVNYANINVDSWTVNEEAEAWRTVDNERDKFDIEEKERQKAAAAASQSYERKQISKEDIAKLYDEAKRHYRRENRVARENQPEWEILQRTQNNDSAYEDKELRFKERDDKNRRDDHGETDWYQNIQNIAELGTQLGYTERHYKNVLSRFISWFNPELSVVTDALPANETARFLLRLHMPDTEEEKIDKQVNKLTRKAGTSLRPVMAYLYEIMSAKYKNSTPAEKETEIRKEMIRGLVKFTRGDLQLEIVQSIEYARRKREKLDWKVMLEKAMEREMIQGMPQVDIRYQNTEASEAALQKLYTVSTGLKYKPRTEPSFRPGKGEYPERNYDSEQEPASKPKITREHSKIL